jgi:hypothetical protein
VEAHFFINKNAGNNMGPVPVNYEKYQFKFRQADSWFIGILTLPCVRPFAQALGKYF